MESGCVSGLFHVMLGKIVPEKKKKVDFNSCPAEPGYTLAGFLKKPADLDLHYLPFSV